MMPAPSGAYCSILYFDIAAFGNPARDNDIQTFVRSGLYRILRRAMDHVSVPWDDCYHEDRGDGVLVIVPPAFPADAIACLPVWLDAEIQRYNKCASSAARIQLRACLHIGPVHWDDTGVYGEALIHAARLIEAQPVKETLASADADLVFVVSGPVYNAVIQHSPQPADTVYRKIKSRVKESNINAWITVPGTRTPSTMTDHRPHLTQVLGSLDHGNRH